MSVYFNIRGPNVIDLTLRSSMLFICTLILYSTVIARTTTDTLLNELNLAIAQASLKLYDEPLRAWLKSRRQGT